MQRLWRLESYVAGKYVRSFPRNLPDLVHCPMFVTSQGERMLVGGESNLVRGAIGIMVDSIVAESRGTQTTWRYGIAWFDCWDPDGRLWLIERITKSFFTPFEPPPRAAIFEATVDAIFAEIRCLVELEIVDPLINQERFRNQERRSWRQGILDAYQTQHRRVPEINVNSIDLTGWSRQIAVIADSITGPLSYQDAEAYRDMAPEACRDYLRRRGLPEDFLSLNPPLRTVDQTQLSIDRIQGIVFDR